MKKSSRKATPSGRKKSKQGHCLQIFRRLSEYLDGELSRERCKEINRHMKGCSNCCAFFNTFKKTVELCKRAPGRRVSNSVRTRLFRRLEKEAG